MAWYHRPAFVGTTIATAGFAAGVGLAALATRLRPKCDEVGEDGGTVAGVRYLERLRGTDDPNAELPMVVLFHSKGGTAKGHAGMLGGIGRARLIVPEGEHTTSGGGRLWFPLGVKSSMKPENREQAEADWRRAAERMALFLRELQKCRPTKGKPVVTGSSMGGEMAYLMASMEPRMVKGAVAVNGYLLPELWNLGMAPTLGIHGDGDTTVPFDWTEEYAAAMKAEGADFSWDPRPSSGHGVTREMGRVWSRGVSHFLEQPDSAWA